MPSGSTTAVASTLPPASTSFAFRAPDACSAALRERGGAVRAPGVAPAVEQPERAEHDRHDRRRRRDPLPATRRSRTARVRHEARRRRRVGASRLLDHGLELLPHSGRRRTTGVRQVRRAVLETAHFGARVGIVGEVLVDLRDARRRRPRRWRTRPGDPGSPRDSTRRSMTRRSLDRAAAGAAASGRCGSGSSRSPPVVGASGRRRGRYGRRSTRARWRRVHRRTACSSLRAPGRRRSDPRPRD